MIKDINITAPINSLSFGIWSYNTIKELLNRNVNVSWWNIGPIENAFGEPKSFYETLIENQYTYNKNAPSLKIWHPFQLSQHIGKGYHCAMTIFELDPIRKIEAESLVRQDIIFVPTHWAKDVVLRSFEHHQVCSLKNYPQIEVVPLGVNINIFSPLYAENEEDNHYTTFFSSGKWEYRKGHDILLEAFNQAFDKKDRVRLWMLCHNPFLEPQANNGVDGNYEWVNSYKTSKLKDKIQLLPRVANHGEVAEIIKRIDCGVFLSRAEGWNLNLLECMAMGKQVITTDYSGHTEFCNKENAFLIDVSNEMEEAFDGKWFFGAENGFGNWAFMDSDDVLEQIVNGMREFHARKQEGNDLINKEGIETAKKFTWQNSVSKLLEYL